MNATKIVVLIAAGLVLLISCKARKFTGSEVKDYGPTIAMGMLDVSTEFVMADDDSDPEDFMEDGDMNEDAIDAAKEHLEYANSALHNHAEHRGHPIGVDRIPSSITIEGAERVNDDYVKVRYHATTNVTVPKAYMATAGSVGILPISFWLPLNPGEIYDQTSCGERCNPCSSDPHYQGEDEFFYFWSPAQCPVLSQELQARAAGREPREPKLVRVTEATIRRKDTTTTRTYPVYDALFANRSAENPLLVTMVVAMYEENADRDTVGYPTYQRIYNEMYRALQESRQQFTAEREVVSTTDEIPSGPMSAAVRDRERTMYRRHRLRIPALKTAMMPRAVPVQIDIYFVNQYDWARKFMPVVAPALEDSDLFMYLGHAGLGRNLRPSRFGANDRPLEMPTDKYQIVYVDACSSWAHYATRFLDTKVTDDDPDGTRSIDFISNGQTGYTINNGAVVLLKRLLFSPSVPTWQSILDEMSRSSANPTDAQMNIVGDTDPLNASPPTFGESPFPR